VSDLLRPAGCSRRSRGVALSAEGGDVGSGDDVASRNTWETWARVNHWRGTTAARAPAGGGPGAPLPPLSIAQIAARLGRSPATVRRTSTTERREGTGGKAHYVGVCRGCGAYTQPRNGKSDAYAHCKACHPRALARRWSREGVLDAMREWQVLFDQVPSSNDWSRTHARPRGRDALARLALEAWPGASVVTDIFETWAAARAAASGQDVEAPAAPT
jgi:hypothetical protein